MINVLEYLENSAGRFPYKTAFADENEQITYSELLTKSRAAASELIKLTPPRSPIAVLGRKGVKTVTMLFACVYAGCFYVPLNPLHPKERISQILKTLGNPFILTDGDCLDLLPEGTKNIITFDEASGGKENAQALKKIREEHIDVDPLYVMFTSGSTGTPKGIAVSHRSVIDFIDEFVSAFNISENDVIGNQAPFDFDVSVKDIYSAIKCGATVQIIPKARFSFPVGLIDFLMERRVTTLIWAVSALCILSSFNAFAYKVPDRINKVLFSGEVMPVKHLNYLKRYLPEAEFINLYGPTEITCNCMFYRVPKGEFAQEVLPIGKPFKNERVFLLDDSGKAITEIKRTGEICVSGTALSLGYYNNPLETRSAFVQNPLNLSWRESVYKTGDLAYVDGDGNFCFVGRKDFQVKHMGHRVELSEIENAILKVEGITRALCIFDVKRDKIWAFYQGTAEEKEIAIYIRSHLPAYMSPHKFVRTDNFPLTENGKIDRKKLKEEYLL